MADQSVGGMVMKLSADGSSFTRGLEKAKSDAKAFENSMRSMQANLSRLSNMAMGALGVSSVSQVLSDSLAAYRESQAAERKLQAVLTATGNAAGWSAEQLKAYAEQLENVTNFEDDATVSAMGTMATFTNVQGKVFKDAIAISQDLASVMGTDLQDAVMKVGKALNDPIGGMGALQKAGVKLTDQQERQIKAFLQLRDIASAQGVVMDALTGKVGGAAKAMVDPIIQAQNAWGKLAEQIGESVQKALAEIGKMIGGFGNLVGRTQAMAMDLEIWSAKHNKWMYENMPMFSSIAAKVGFGGVGAENIDQYIAELEKMKADFLKGPQMPPGSQSPIQGREAQFSIPIDAEEKRRWEARKKYLLDYMDQGAEAAKKIRLELAPLDEQFENSLLPALTLAREGLLTRDQFARFAEKEKLSMLGGLKDVTATGQFTPNMTPGSREAVRAIQGGMSSPAERLVRIGDKQLAKLDDIKRTLDAELSALLESLPKEGQEP